MDIEFHSNLITARVPTSGARPKSRLLRDLRVTVNGKDITVPAGYESDWASTPRAIWWLYPPTYAPAQRGAWLHDFIYTDLHDEYSKESADKALAAAVRHDGGSAFSARMFYWATRMFGQGGWA